MSKNTKMSNILESFLKDIDRNTKTVTDMTRDEFNKFVVKKGHVYPKHTKPGSRYLNVFGAAKRVNTKKPFGLIVYDPRDKMREEYYKDPEEALHNAPDGGLWQVMNLWTMKVIYDPFNIKQGVD